MTVVQCHLFITKPPFYAFRHALLLRPRGTASLTVFHAASLGFLPASVTPHFPSLEAGLHTSSSAPGTPIVLNISLPVTITSAASLSPSVF